MCCNTMKWLQRTHLACVSVPAEKFASLKLGTVQNIANKIISRQNISFKGIGWCARGLYRGLY